MREIIGVCFAGSDDSFFIFRFQAGKAGELVYGGQVYFNLGFQGSSFLRTI
jgi:hypothetical protein